MDYEELLEQTGLDRIPEYWDTRYTKNLKDLSKPVYGIIEELDVPMVLSDGTRLSVDIYRPCADPTELFPALVAWAAYGKSMQALKRGAIPPQSVLFDHSLEAGDIEFFVKRGYIYVIPDPRGIGQSEGEFLGVYNPQEQEDAAELVEWAATLPYCSGDVGMIGFSYFGIIQMLTAAKQPVHLKCIMPLSFTDDYYQHGHYGGVANTYLSIYWELCPSNNPVPWSEKIYSPVKLKEMMRQRLEDPDVAFNSYFNKILTTWPPRYHTYYLDVLLHPLDGSFWRERSAQEVFDKVQVPVYIKNDTNSPIGRWASPGFNAFMDSRLRVPKKLSCVESYSSLELPYRVMNEEILRWYDHWLKGIDTGILDEPPMKIQVMDGPLRFEQQWPLERTVWKKYYLRSFGKLKDHPDAEKNLPPDCFHHVPPNVTEEVQSLVYTSEPFTRPVEFTGPVTLYLYVSIDTGDANIIVNLWNILPDGSRHPVRRYGALRMSHPYLREKSKPWAPVHDHTASLPVNPGDIREYVIEINPLAWVFLPGHRLQLEIKAMDPDPVQKHSWVGKVGNMGPLPGSEPVSYKIFRDSLYRSYLLMPEIKSSPADLVIQPLTAGK